MTRQILRKTKLRQNLIYSQIDSIKFNNSVLYQFDLNQSAGDLRKSLERMSFIKYVTFNSKYKQLSLILNLETNGILKTLVNQYYRQQVHLALISVGRVLLIISIQSMRYLLLSGQWIC